jgi:hypothetical protein
MDNAFLRRIIPDCARPVAGDMRKTTVVAKIINAVSPGLNPLGEVQLEYWPILSNPHDSLSQKGYSLQEPNLIQKEKYSEKKKKEEENHSQSLLVQPKKTKPRDYK